MVTLCIHWDDVEAILLADGWHDVAEDSALCIGAYEYTDAAEVQWETFGGTSGVGDRGFEFRDAVTGCIMFGPVTSILAVRMSKEPRHPD